MKSLTDSDGYPHVFHLAHNDGGLWLYDGWTKPGNDWGPGDGFVFSLRKPR